MKNADMPAMPILEEGNISEGLTKRETFAMNAPGDIPEWFSRGFNADTSSTEKPDLSEHQVNMMDKYINDTYNMSDEDFKIGSDASSINNEYLFKCYVEREKRLYFSWKLFYADALLAELDK